MSTNTKTKCGEYDCLNFKQLNCKLRPTQNTDYWQQRGEIYEKVLKGWLFFKISDHNLLISSILFCFCYLNSLKCINKFNLMYYTMVLNISQLLFLRKLCYEDDLD